MRPGPDRFAAIVQKKREIKNKRVLQLLKNLAISDQLRIRRLRQGIKFINANQCMLISRVTMEKLMLHQAGKLAELRNVPAQKIDPMHHSEDSACSALFLQDLSKDRARPARILIGPGNLAQPSAQQILQFRAELEAPFLRDLKCLHHLLRVFAK